MKRLLQYSQSKKQNNYALFHPLTSRSPLILPTLLLSSLYTRAYCIYHALGYACSFLVSASASRHECFSHAVLLDMHVMSYMRCLASRFRYLHASLLYLYTSHLVLRGSMHLLYTIRYTLFCTCTAYF